jgi:anti-sigma factor RsiW
MTSDWHEIREIDLMAYADGLLNDDTKHKAAIEAYLAANPAEARRVKAIIEDNRAIRQRYRDALQATVPDRLLQTVYAPANNRMLPAIQKIAASLILAAVAASGGWLAGQQFGNENNISAGLLRDAAGYHSATDETAPLNAAANRSAGNILHSSGRSRVRIEIPIPDLSPHGFELISRERMIDPEHETLRIIYESADNTLNLFLRLHGKAAISPVTREQTGDVVVYHWSDGPLAYAITAQNKDQDIARLAEIVREAAAQAYFTNPVPENQGEAVAGDSLLGIQQPEATESMPAKPSNTVKSFDQL